MSMGQTMPRKGHQIDVVQVIIVELWGTRRPQDKT